eukprot:2551215-Prymnesium_polylepis.1
MSRRPPRGRRRGPLVGGHGRSGPRRRARTRENEQVERVQYRDPSILLKPGAVPKLLKRRHRETPFRLSHTAPSSEQRSQASCA